MLSVKLDGGSGFLEALKEAIQEMEEEKETKKSKSKKSDGISPSEELVNHKSRCFSRIDEDNDIDDIGDILKYICLKIDKLEDALAELKSKP